MKQFNDCSLITNDKVFVFQVSPQIGIAQTKICFMQYGSA